MSRNVCLTGMMGAGKSTVAVLVGRRLGRSVVDTDTELRRWTGNTIAELFERHGEAGFRDLERQVVAELAGMHDLVIALGGGVVLRDDNVEALKLTGVVVHLDAPPEVLAARLRRSQDRPLLGAGQAGEHDAPDEAALLERLRELHAARDARYRAVADVALDASRPADVVAGDVISWALSQGDVLTPSEHEQVMT